MSDRTGAVEKLLAMVTRTDGAAAPELDLKARRSRAAARGVALKPKPFLLSS